MTNNFQRILKIVSPLVTYAVWPRAVRKIAALVAMSAALCGCAPIGGSGKGADVSPTPAPGPAPATSELGRAVDESMRAFRPAMASAWRDAGKEPAKDWDEAIAAVRRSMREAREKSFSPLTDRIEAETGGEFSESKFRDLCERVAKGFEENQK